MKKNNKIKIKKNLKNQTESEEDVIFLQKVVLNQVQLIRKYEEDKKQGIIIFIINFNS